MKLSDILFLLFLLSPILVSAIIIFTKNESLVGVVDRVSEWLARKESEYAQSNVFWVRNVIRWVFWPFKKLEDMTAAVSSRFLRSGMRALLYGCYALLLLFVIAVVSYMVAIIAMAIFIVVALYDENKKRNDDSDSATESDGINRRLAELEDEITASSSIRDQKLYSGTNWFNEELAGRVDAEGNLYRGSNWFNEEKIGRIDDEGNIYSGANWATEMKVGRVDKDGTLHKGSNWFTEEVFGRIEKDGSIIKGANWFTEEKIGRSGGD